MTLHHSQTKASKARLINRWGCSVGHAFFNFNPPSRLKLTHTMKTRSLIALALWVINFGMLVGIGVAHPQTATPDAVALTATERVERLMRELPEAKVARRLEIVAELYSFTGAKNADPSIPLMRFGYDVTQNSDGTKTRGAKPDRNQVLRKVIPILIDMIDDRERMDCKAWWILISLQSSCLEPKKATWQRWWQEDGSKAFKDSDR